MLRIIWNANKNNSLLVKLNHKIRRCWWGDNCRDKCVIISLVNQRDRKSVCDYIFSYKSPARFSSRVCDIRLFWASARFFSNRLPVYRTCEGPNQLSSTYQVAKRLLVTNLLHENSTRCNSWRLWCCPVWHTGAPPCCVYLVRLVLVCFKTSKVL